MVAAEHVQLEEEEDDNEALLVSEFPPPPFYYKRAASLTPPPIPHEAFVVAAKRVSAMASAAAAEAERTRLLAMGSSSDAAAAMTPKLETNVILGGELPSTTTTTEPPTSSSVTHTTNATTDPSSDTTAIPGTSATTMGTSLDAPTTTSAVDINQDDSVVAVFGEIVEDPLLVDVLDDYEDPTKIRDTVRQLNNQVGRGFVKLVQELVHRPLDNKKCRDELSHNIFLMLQECNKFREHQAREILIQTLEQQLVVKQEALTQLKEHLSEADAALTAIHAIESSSIIDS
mmetsp:Transcript_29171/g.53381  ORF Transcript_29171/g.53381 Transcript_29171/m.53381 type:complete len:287 (-) Transcript_29171:72-932(-)